MRIFIKLCLLLVLTTSCEDVIDLPLTEGPKKLVIDANINWLKGTTGNEQVIRLTETTGYYDLDIPVASGASVRISNGTTDYLFQEEGQTGIYKTTSFVPELNKEYTLSITYNGENFTATETLISVPDITKVEQKPSTTFFSDIDIDFSYDDPEDEENYYLGEFSSNVFLLNQYFARRDELTNGGENNTATIRLSEDDYLVTDPNVEKFVVFRLYGISKNYHDYANLLFDQIENQGPFATPPAALRGNCINTTNTNNKPFGFFRLSEVAERKHIIE